MSHIERRANLWYATLHVPPDAREVIGKSKFIQSLGTPDKREAIAAAAPLIAYWKAQIKQARGSEGAVAIEAKRWREMLSTAVGVEREVLEETLREKAEGLSTSLGESAAQDFYQIATSQRTESTVLFEQWKTSLDVAPKTKDQYVKDVELLLSRFKSLEAITKSAITSWVDDYEQRGYTNSTLNRILIACRSYWKYLAKYELVTAEPDPFRGHVVSAKKKTKGKKGWVPFTADEVVALHRAAVSRNDQALADLIVLGAYTGARIEEICSLKVADIKREAIQIVDSKTVAGIREVPIHCAIKHLLQRLSDATDDGYLISHLSFNKYEDRSNAIGKRFGRLKKQLGHPESKVFHSIRKTFVTLLENEGVPEGVVADIIGHEKPNLTFGLYSGGNNINVKTAAVEKLSYPFEAPLS